MKPAPHDPPGGDPETDRAEPAADYHRLPARIPFAAMTTSQPASDPPSPDFGRDPDHEWMLRFGAS